MEEEKKLYPFKLMPITDEGPENIQLADLGEPDSVIRNGWLAANTISEVMDMYMDRILGEDIFAYYGRQFPVMIKFIDCTERTPLMVHPDDEIAAQRFDFLGKAKLWYVTKAQSSAKLFLGFRRDVSPEEFYMACRHGNVEELLNIVEPEVGKHYFIHPGLIHCAEGVEIAEIAESSPLDFRLFNWGKSEELDEFDAELTLEAAFDFIDYCAYEAEGCCCHHAEGESCHCHEEGHECHCHDNSEGEEHECHCHAGGHHHGGGCCCHHHDVDEIMEKLTHNPEFTVTRVNLSAPLHIFCEQFGSFLTYTCIKGHVSIQVPSQEGVETYELSEKETILVPAEVPDLFLVPQAVGTVLLETMEEKRESLDPYINPFAEESTDDNDSEAEENFAHCGHCCHKQQHLS